VSGSLQDTCVAGSPTGLDDNCDGLDQNCNGVADDAYVPTATSCGVGECAAAGQMVCVSGTLQDTCAAGSPTGLDDDCDGLDQNCNGLADDAYVPIPTSCGVGECASTGSLACIAGSMVNTCSPGLPASEICDGLDNNCNGVVDDGGDALCDNGLYCDGAESCGGSAGCQPGIAPAVDDGIACTTDWCDETNDLVAHTPNDAYCDNGVYCDGMEYCDPALDCQPGVPVACDDGESCTADSCNEEIDACDNIPIDNDGDGYSICAGPARDCDDGNDAVNPGAAEICNGVDDNCDGNEDEGNLDADCMIDGCYGNIYFDYYCATNDGAGCLSVQYDTDLDGDGYNIECEGDCIDDPSLDVPDCGQTYTCAADIHPNAPEVCEDGVDQDCLGGDSLCEGCDQDGDGYRVGTFFCSLWQGRDCDDTNANVHYGAEEICDGIDNDCDDGFGSYDTDPSTGVDNRDADADAVNDCSGADKCLGTILPESIPTVELKPNNYADIDGDGVLEVNDPQAGIVDGMSLASTYGCTCEQILDCKPGQNNGEIKNGCSPGTIEVWKTQTGWSQECQDLTTYGVLVVRDGIAKPVLEDTDLDGIPDVDDTDDDGDGIPDTEDLMSEDKEHDGRPDWHKRN